MRTIELDSAYNPYDTTAAMVYPADNFTMKLFGNRGRIDDAGALANYQMDLIRFVKPFKIRLLKDFAQLEIPDNRI